MPGQASARTTRATSHLPTQAIETENPDDMFDSTGMELSGYQRYHPARHQFAKRENQIAITRAGNLSLTGDLGELIVDHEEGKGWVQLAYNTHEKRIAIIQADKNDVDILRVSRTPKGHRYQITARRFLETYGVPVPDKGTLYRPTLRFMGDKQVFIIQV